MSELPLRLGELIDRLVAGEVSFVLVGGLATTVRVCSLEHLIAMKQASTRPRDIDDLEALVALRDRDGEQPAPDY